jgi:arabinogalactan oligomer / maltooligosaccharide transport system permease protein
LRVRFFTLLALAILVALLPACAEPPRAIVLWHAYRGNEQDAIERLARAYSDTHGVRVELLALPFEAYVSKLESAVPHAHGPDAFIEAHERIGSFVASGIVAPVGDALPDEDVARFDRVAIDAVTHDGARYAVPLASKCLALYLNDALVPNDPATLEDVTRLRASLPPSKYPLAYEARTTYFHIPFLHAFGGELIDANDHYAFVGDAAARSVDFVREMTSARIIPDEPSETLVHQLFAAGDAASIISGPWFAAEIGDAVKFRVVPLPNLEAAGGRPMRPYLTVEAAFVTPTGARRDDVRAFVRWLGSEESAIVRATVGDQVVATESAWNDPGVAKKSVLAAFHRASKLAIATPTSTSMRAAWVPAEQAIRKALRGDATATAALDEGRARFDDAMKPPPPPPSAAPLMVVFSVLLLGLAFTIVQRVRDPAFRREVRASVPAYKLVAHAVVAVGLLVVLPLGAGALASLFAGTRDAPTYVGLGNYVLILTARGRGLLSNGSFYLTLIVTVVWTLANVALHVSIGLVLGALLSRPVMRLRAFYRVLLILPWAVPSYVTALAWKGMFHRQFGAINALLALFGVAPVSWFSHFSTAFAANVATNVWLGFPFMMVVTIGALTSIPKDVLEAAEVDGATRWQRFRLVTFPLLLPTLAPAVVLGAVWTFNMFNVVFLVSGGEPDETTDILVSEAYRWAFTRNAQYGYAAAYAVLIFGLLVMTSRAFGWITSKREEVVA